MSFPDDTPPRFSQAQWQRGYVVFQERYPYHRWANIPIAVRIGFLEELILEEGPVK